MTLCAAWIKKKGNSEELIVATDSRLRSLGSWDCNPKIFTFPRTDCFICFAGDTGYAYPMIMQLQTAIRTNHKSKNRIVKLSVFKGILLKIISDMLQNKSDFEIPETTFLFGGYCWFNSEFQLWEIHFDKNLDKFAYRPVKYWKGVSGSKKVKFIGDYTKEAKEKLVELLKKKKKLISGNLEYEPLEVLRDMLLESKSEQRLYKIGGPIQMIKVYKHLNVLTFGVKWKVLGEEKVTLLGRPLEIARHSYPIFDPFKLTYSNTNKYDSLS